MTANRARRRYRAPEYDRSWLLAMSNEPTPDEIPFDHDQAAKISHALQSACDATIRNRNELQLRVTKVFDGSFPDLRREAREEILDIALSATSSLRTVHLSSKGPGPDAPFIFTGHQPSLFHPGVWAKNFAADRIARMAGGRSIHLVVDTDVLHDRGIRVPERDDRQVHFGRIDYDAASPAAPYVDARVADETIFASFGSRLSEHMRSHWGIVPLIESNWPDAELKSSLSDCFTTMRHVQELRWDLSNLELPLSQLATTTAFSRFFLDIVRRADEFLDIHNRAVVGYRRAHKLRSESHPVPLLARDRAAIELPFWAWEAGETHRRPLYAVRGQNSIELSYDVSHFPLAEIPFQPSDADYDLLFDHFFSEGMTIAPRALTTTLFCRVWLADLFIHGIGGAVYDQMTDSLIREFYGIEPPPFLVVTATLHLPIGDVPKVTADDIHRQQRLIRELEHQPERHVPAARPELLAEKQKLIAEEQARHGMVMSRPHRRSLRPENHLRWLRLKEINAELAGDLADRRENARAELLRLQASLKSKQVLESREFSAWLYPEAMLREFYSTLTG